MVGDYRARPAARLSERGGFKRKRRIEIIRYSSRIAVIQGDDTTDFGAADGTAANIALKMLEDASFALKEVNGEVNGGEPAGKKRLGCLSSGISPDSSPG